VVSFPVGVIPVSTWESYATNLLIPLGGSIILCGFLVYLLIEIRRRKRSEDALKEREHLFRSLVDASSQSVWHYRPGGLPIKRIDQASVAWWCEFTGQSVAKRTSDGGMGWLDVVHDEDREVARRHWLTLASARASTSAEYRVRRRDGAWRWLMVRSVPVRDEQGAITSWAGTVSDVTERKQAEDAMRASEEKYRKLFSEMAIGCALHQIICDPSGKPVDYITLEINDAFERLLSAKRADVVGKRASEILPPAELAKWVEIFGSVALTGKSTHFETYSEFNGKHFEGIAFCPEAGKFAGTFMDVTERKQGAEEREKLQAQLAQSQKMESVGRLAGGVAHDFNNLLMGIMGYAELCQARIAQDHPIREWLDEIIQNAHRSASLTQQLLAFARRQPVASRVIELNTPIESMLQLLRRLIGESITINWRPGSGLWPIKMDPSQIDQVLANLAVNARDAIGGVGSITIETGAATLVPAYCSEHSGSLPGDYTVLTVTDNGCGMDRETLTHIFEPFYTTKGVGGGSGMGLATVYGIVSQNGGFIDVDSEVGKGTTFRIYLPRFVTPEPVPVAAEIPIPTPPGNETVLLVDDEKSVRVTTFIFLEDLGYTVLVAEDPEEALRLAAAYHGIIHLLVTDVVMPGMSGYDLAHRLSELRPDIKCLFMSGFAADFIPHKGILDTGLNFLAKPFSRDVLARKVREVLGGQAAGIPTD